MKKRVRLEFWDGPLAGQVWRLPRGNHSRVVGIVLGDGQRYEPMGFGTMSQGFTGSTTHRTFQLVQETGRV